MTNAIKASLTYRIVAAGVFGAMRLSRWRINRTGTEHLPPTGGFVIAANHQSAIDAFILGHAAYRKRRQPVYILVKHSLFNLPIIGQVMRASGNISVDRSAGANAYTKARNVLQAGGIILVFPEQTISPSFELLDFKAGAIRLARDANVPIIPAASFGSHRFQTLGRRPRLLFGLPVEVVYGKAFTCEGDLALEVAVSRLKACVVELYETAMRSYPGGLPAGAWWVPARLGGSALTHADALTWREAVLRHVGTGARRSLKYRRR